MIHPQKIKGSANHESLLVFIFDPTLWVRHCDSVTLSYEMKELRTMRKRNDNVKKEKATAIRYKYERIRSVEFRKYALRY